MSAALPPLEEDCPDCTGPQADADRAANAKAWQAWRTEEQAGYVTFSAEHENDAYLLWESSPAYQELKDRQPVEWPEVGCDECDYTGMVPTDAGLKVLEFVRRHVRGAQ